MVTIMKRLETECLSSSSQADKDASYIIQRLNNEVKKDGWKEKDGEREIKRQIKCERGTNGPT